MVSSKLENLMPIFTEIIFWLSTHVTTVVSSYGTFCFKLDFIFYFLIKKRFFKNAIDQVHKIILLVSGLLTTGILLVDFGQIKVGGDFGAWDPKETWSLIVLLTYGYSSWLFS